MSAHAKVVDKDTGWAALFRRVKAARDGRVKVGVLADDPKGSEHEEGSSLTIAQLASVLHFGTENGHIPPRPFLSMAFDQQREALADMGGKLLAEVIEGHMDQERALGLVGAKLAAESKKVITIGEQLKANAPSTVAAKGSSRPLVDTGRLLGAITWAIDKEHE